MVRRASILAAALVVLPAIALAQEPPRESGTHTVSRGETLWDLARTYYGNPFDWRRIYEANSDRIENPHWIYPGQELVIPGTEPARVTDVQVSQPTPRASEPGMCPGLGDRTVFHEEGAQAGGCDLGAPGSRSIFYQSSESVDRDILASDRTPWLAVPWDIFYSAGWMSPEAEAGMRGLGSIDAFDSPDTGISDRDTAQPYERLRITLRAAPGSLRVGDLLQSFRVERSVRRLAQEVMLPTGLLTVAEIADSGVVAVVSNEYDRVRLGDRVRIAPSYPLEPGYEAEPVPDGPVGSIILPQRKHELQQLGDVLFIDLGSADGLAVGDELVVSAGSDPGWDEAPAGRLQVVGVRERSASARIIQVRVPVFDPGVVVRLDARLP